MVERWVVVADGDFLSITDSTDEAATYLSTVLVVTGFAVRNLGLASKTLSKSSPRAGVRSEKAASEVTILVGNNMIATCSWWRTTVDNERRELERSIENESWRHHVLDMGRKMEGRIAVETRI